ncbi:MAG: hypothetical protein BMS9Abin26_0013 [Gammaproteobacteria bacterium]|nr:MAG: hypothetical protein BMS9Abin26_0013 [Gammaproteobacteria bacterium]
MTVKSSSHHNKLPGTIRTDRRVWLISAIVGLAVIIGVLLLLSVMRATETHDEMHVLDVQLEKAGHFEGEFNKLNVAVSRFMLLAHNASWGKVLDQVQNLRSAAVDLSNSSNPDSDDTDFISRKLLPGVDGYIKRLMPLKSIRQSGIVSSEIGAGSRLQSGHYSFIERLSLAIESLRPAADDEPDDLRQLNELQRLHIYWMNIITEFRAHLLLRNEDSLVRVRDFLGVFDTRWADTMKRVDSFNFDIQPFLQEADVFQQQWRDTFDSLIAKGIDAGWRTDLSYVVKYLEPISDNIIGDLHKYSASIKTKQHDLSGKIIGNERNIIILASIVISVSTLLSLVLIVIFNRLLREQQESRYNAEQANTMKTQFLSRVSHELRTPLNAILGFAQLLDTDTKEPLTAYQQDSLNEILRGSYHLLDLINEVLDLTKIESGKYQLNYEEINVADVVNECLAMTAPMVRGRSIQIINKVDAGDNIQVHADHLRLKQALLNLLSNAVKYSDDNSVVTVAANQNHPGFVNISVTDTGIGIPIEAQNKIFAPFERLRSIHDIEGSGIGLAVTKGLVEAMAGRIGVLSAPGKGSTFWFELPAAAPTGQG